MENSIISIKNIGKRYNITHQRGGYLALRDVLANAILSPFKFAKRKIKQIAGMETQEIFWALRDVNLEIQKGEIVGIIGPNGAGKSTLLKILSQITPPTEGEIKIRGTVGSLLEVGTGFHAELTGRENIFLNGAILGMTKKEIVKKFDEIVAFAGIGKFIDTPVKRYSSGMYVRLAFSVAAHMEPDILIIDEVLAVGDAEFQKKCLGKMNEITKEEGRTILFVSHNMEAIKQICTKCVILNDGRIVDVGAPVEIVEEYLHKNQSMPAKIFARNTAKHEAWIRSVSIKNADGRETGSFGVDEPFFIEVEYELGQELPAHIVLKIFMPSLAGHNLFVSWSNDNNQTSPKEPGVYRAIVKINPLLNTGEYSFLVGVATHTEDYLDNIVEYNAISIHNDGQFAFPAVYNGRNDALVVIPNEWAITKIS